MNKTSKIIWLSFIITLTLWCLYSWLFIYYMIGTYLFEPHGHWKVLSNLCCELTQKIPMYVHIFAGTIIMIIGPLQICQLSHKLKIHKVTGYIYIISCLFVFIGGFSFIILNDTVGGLLMSIPFSIYGFLILLHVLVAYVYIHKQDYYKHRRWGIRLFMLGNASWLYRILYTITCHVITKCLVITWTSTMDYIFDWAFFIIPMIVSEIYLLIFP